MIGILYNYESLERHGVTEAEADDVVATGIWDELTSSERGNDRLMFVGFSSGGRLLEVGVEYFDNANMEYVFHANDATRHYQALFKKGKSR